MEKNKANANITKCIKLFQQLVNPKIEPIIGKILCFKLSQKQKESERFVVATISALYVCKNTSITRNLKICNCNPWVDLSKFQMKDMESFVFAFKSGKFNLSSPDPTHFLGRVLNYLKSFLPPHLSEKIEVPSTVAITKDEHISKYNFLPLFISFSHLLSVPTDVAIHSSLKRSLRHRGQLKILKINYSDGVIRALCLALADTSQIRDVKIGGKNFPRLYGNLELILKNNKTLTSLHIFHYEKDDDFDLFIEALKDSSVVKLTLEKIFFNQQMTAAVIKNIAAMPLTALNFIDCSLGQFMIIPLFGAACACKKVNHFSITDDRSIEANSDFYSTLATFSTVTGITSLGLSNVNIDISKFFDSLSESVVTYLDLSGNRCTKSFTGLYTFPPSIQTLVLKNVRWSVVGLLRLMGKQQFRSMVEFDFSNAIFGSEEKIGSFFNNIVKCQASPMVSSIHWDNNPIHDNLLNYFSQFKLLKELSLNDCVVLPKLRSDEVFKSLLELVRNTDLAGIYLQKTMKVYKKKFMSEFKSVFSLHQTLGKIDVSDNSIGDEGIDALLEVLLINPRITYLAFDGSEAQKAITYVNFLQGLSNLQQLKYISKPRNDLKKFATNSKKLERDFKTYWKRIRENIKQNIGAEDEETDSTTNSTLFSMQSDSQSYADFVQPGKVLVASWEFDEALYDGNLQEWDALRQLFSYANITSIK